MRIISGNHRAERHCVIGLEIPEPSILNIDVTTGLAEDRSIMPSSDPNRPGSNDTI
jgi:hypothetical protein